MVDMNDFRLWAQGFRCYKKSGLGMTWMTQGYLLRALNVMNISRLWWTSTNLGHELRTLDAINNLLLSMTRATGSRVQGSRYYEHMSTSVGVNDSQSWAQASWCYKQLRVVDDMKDYGSWAQGSWCYEHLGAIEDRKHSGSWTLGFRLYE